MLHIRMRPLLSNLKIFYRRRPPSRRRGAPALPLPPRRQAETGDGRHQHRPAPQSARGMGGGARRKSGGLCGVAAGIPGFQLLAPRTADDLFAALAASASRLEPLARSADNRAQAGRCRRNVPTAHRARAYSEAAPLWVRVASAGLVEAPSADKRDIPMWLERLGA
jgi:hypothetical protein